jgi:hypothetical protein
MNKIAIQSASTPIIPYFETTLPAKKLITTPSGSKVAD